MNLDNLRISLEDQADKHFSARKYKGRRKKVKNWQESNTQKQKAYVKKHNLKKNYGITEEEYKNLLAKYDYRCAVCQQAEGEPKIKLCIDHDHKTGKIRGILCSKCNAALGMLDDTPERIIKLFQYLSSRLTNTDSLKDD